MRVPSLVLSSAVLVLLVLAPTSCEGGAAICDGVFAVRGADPAKPQLRYCDGQVARNDSCMIRLGRKLNPKVPPLYVNGEPVGFC